MFRSEASFFEKFPKGAHPEGSEFIFSIDSLYSRFPDGADGSVLESKYERMENRTIYDSYEASIVKKSPRIQKMQRAPGITSPRTRDLVRG